MARTAPRARPDREQVLETVHAHCPACGGRLRYRYDNRHTVRDARRPGPPAAAHPPLRGPGLRALPPALPAGGRGRARAAAARVRPRRHRPGRGAALPRAPERACDRPRACASLLGRRSPSARSPTCSTAEPSLGAPSSTGGRAGGDLRGPTTTGCGRSWPGRGGRSWRSTASSRTSATRSRGLCASACRARSCSPGACCPRRARTWRRCCARSPPAIGVPIAGVASAASRR